MAIMANGRHAGLLFRVDGGGVKLLHLSGHYRLRIEDAFPEDLFWAEIAEIEPENLASLTAYINAVATNMPKTPYGLSDVGIEFERATGHLVITRNASGLTCATFILAILRAQQMEPLDRNGWPIGRAEDIAFQQSVVEALRHASYDVRADEIEKDVGLARFRPSEVVGASAVAGWSHNASSARVLAAQVLADME
ncbi:MAG: hypothetical protein ACK4JY_13730 [Brevundimonas sp.]